MPRARQGARLPNPAQNRTDLAGKVPKMTQPGQTYGKQTAQQQSQSILPVAAPPVAAGGAAAPGAAPAAPQQPAGGFPAATPGPEPAHWLRPTERPNEPLTAGMATGAGGGPQILGGFGKIANAQQNEQGTLQSLLQHLSSQPGASSVVKGMAANAGVTTI